MKKIVLYVASALAMFAQARDTNRYDRVEVREGFEFSQRGGLGTSNEVVTAVSLPVVASNLAEGVSFGPFSNAVAKVTPPVEQRAETDPFVSSWARKNGTSDHAKPVFSVTTNGTAATVTDGTLALVEQDPQVSSWARKIGGQDAPEPVTDISGKQDRLPFATNEIVLVSDLPDRPVGEGDFSVSYPEFSERDRRLATLNVGSSSIDLDLPADLGMTVSNGTKRVFAKTSGGISVSEAAKSADGSQSYVRFPNGAFVRLDDHLVLRIGGTMDPITGKITGDRPYWNVIREETGRISESAVTSNQRVIGSVQRTDTDFIDATVNGSNSVQKTSEDYLSVKSRISSLESSRDIIYDTGTNWVGNSGTRCVLNAGGKITTDRFVREMVTHVTTNSVRFRYPLYVLHKEKTALYNNQVYTIDRMCFKAVSPGVYQYDHNDTLSRATCSVISPAQYRDYGLNMLRSKYNSNFTRIDAGSPFSVYVIAYSTYASSYKYFMWNGTTRYDSPSYAGLVSVPSGSESLEGVLESAAAGTRTTLGYASVDFVNSGHSNALRTPDAEWYFDTSVGGMSDYWYERVVSVETNDVVETRFVTRDITYAARSPKEIRIEYDSDGKPALVTESDATDVSPWTFTSFYGYLSGYRETGFSQSAVTNTAPYRGIVNGVYLWSVTNDVTMWSSDPYVYWGNVTYDPVSGKWTFSAVECSWLNSGGDYESGLYVWPKLHPNISTYKYLTDYPVVSESVGFPVPEGSGAFGVTSVLAVTSDGPIDEETGRRPGSSASCPIFAVDYRRSTPTASFGTVTNVLVSVRSDMLPQSMTGGFDVGVKTLNGSAVLILSPKGE